MDTKHVLDELLAQYEESPGVPAGLDAEEAELVKRVMNATPEARVGGQQEAEQPARQVVYSR